MTCNQFGIPFCVWLEADVILWEKCNCREDSKPLFTVCLQGGRVHVQTQVWQPHDWPDPWPHACSLFPKEHIEPQN